MTCGTDEEYAA